MGQGLIIRQQSLEFLPEGHLIFKLKDESAMRFRGIVRLKSQVIHNCDSHLTRNFE